jgi:hypothetical protein
LTEHFPIFLAKIVVENLEDAARDVPGLLKPGARFVICMMERFAPVEVIWFLRRIDLFERIAFALRRSDGLCIFFQNLAFTLSFSAKAIEKAININGEEFHVIHGFYAAHRESQDKYRDGHISSPVALNHHTLMSQIKERA